MFLENVEIHTSGKLSMGFVQNLNVSFDVAIDILDFTKNEKIILKEYFL